jgi:putative glutamine amidotransferase
MSKGRPLIGITTRHEPGRVEFYLQRHYPEAVYAAGGLPVLIPLIDGPDYLNQLIEDLDGMIFSGSRTDVDPRRYGQEPVPGLGEVDALRDNVDIHLAREALDRKMPVFAICYGFQMLNVMLGGTLIQDLPSLRSGNVKHGRNHSSEEIPEHMIALESGSLLEQLAGSRSVKVNSTHHQAIDVLSADLKLAAAAPDGVIEAALHPDKPVIAVQWHPERSFEEDPFSRRLFEHFVKLCKEFRRMKS